MDTYASPLEFSTSADEQRTQFVSDFNPSVDKIRVTSDAGMNLRLNADEGAVLLGGREPEPGHAAGRRLRLRERRRP